MKILLFILGFLVWTSSAFAEKVILRSGFEVDGRILEKTDKFVKVNFLGTPVTYYSDEVYSVEGQKFEEFFLPASASSLPEVPVSVVSQEAAALSDVPSLKDSKSGALPDGRKKKE